MGHSTNHKQNRPLDHAEAESGHAVLERRFEAGQLIPVIDGPYKLSEAREAFRHFGTGTHKGNVIITMD
jgi:hypothetical protein